MEQFLELVSNSGQLGLSVGVAVLALVYFLNRAGVVASKGQKQAANLILSTLLAGVELLDPELEKVVAASLASLGSALAYEFIRFLLAKKDKV